MSKGCILYEGPSLIDKAPIVCIATFNSKNEKTGNMIQTWILRQDISPLEAIYNGGDNSICGDCKHRGDVGRNRTCYVSVHQAPLNIWRSYLKGNYPKEIDKNQFVGRKIRLGSYGDPAAIPYEIWLDLIRLSDGWTAYTHAWKYADPRLQNICMASVDTPTEQKEATAVGWRTFRVRTEDSPLEDHEFSCPASEESGNIRTCETCTACNGTLMAWKYGRPNVSIVVHGKSWIPAKFAQLTIGKA